MKKLIIVIFIIKLTEVNSQVESKWYSMDSKLDIENAWCPYTSELCDSSMTLKFAEQFDYVENLIVSRFNISGNSESLNQNIKSHIYGIRGSIGNKQILIIDSDMDNSFIDESVIFLPELEKDESIPYDQFDYFPSNENYNFNLKYEILRDEQIHEKNSNIGIKVNHYLDKKTGFLNYRNEFNICFNQKLYLELNLNNTDFSISTYDFFPWINTIQFALSHNKSENTKIDIKSVFTLNEKGNKYKIDSLDLINNKVLISKTDTIQKIYLRSESLFSNQILDTDSTSKELKIIHFWGSWCIGCLKNFPALSKLKIQNASIRLIGICVDRNKEQAKDTANKYGINWNNLYYTLEDEKFTSSLNILSYPTYLIVEDNSIIERFHNIDQVSRYINNRKNPTDNKR